MPNWSQVLSEVNSVAANGAQFQKGAFDLVRRRYLDALHNKTQRNVIAYYSGFLSKPEIPSSITDEDKNGFMQAVHGLDRSKGLDLILHTPGGGITATQSIVDYLRKMFGKDIRAIVPQIALSAGTMIACSCKSIMMAKHSNLGPIDPQVWNENRSNPAYGVIEEFKRACKEVKSDKTKIPIWQAIISHYHPTYLSRCENAIKLSNEFVEEQLKNVMFDAYANAKQRARNVVRKLTDYGGNKTHDRHIHVDECVNIGLTIEILENDQDLQDLVLTVHHCFIHALTNTTAYKMIENHKGIAYVKQAQVQVVKQ